MSDHNRNHTETNVVLIFILTLFNWMTCFHHTVSCNTYVDWVWVIDLFGNGSNVSSLHNDAYLELIPYRYKNNHNNIHLTHWGRVTHRFVSKLTTIGSDNGLSPWRRQAIIRTNAWISLLSPFGTNFSEIVLEMYTFQFKKCIWKCCLENGGHFFPASRIKIYMVVCFSGTLL